MKINMPTTLPQREFRVRKVELSTVNRSIIFLGGQSYKQGLNWNLGNIWPRMIFSLIK